MKHSIRNNIVYPFRLLSCFLLLVSTSIELLGCNESSVLLSFEPITIINCQTNNNAYSIERLKNIDNTNNREMSKSKLPSTHLGGMVSAKAYPTRIMESKNNGNGTVDAAALAGAASSYNPMCSSTSSLTTATRNSIDKVVDLGSASLEESISNIQITVTASPNLVGALSFKLLSEKYYKKQNKAISISDSETPTESFIKKPSTYVNFTATIGLQDKTREPSDEAFPITVFLNDLDGEVATCDFTSQGGESLNATCNNLASACKESAATTVVVHSIADSTINNLSDHLSN